MALARHYAALRVPSGVLQSDQYFVILSASYSPLVVHQLIIIDNVFKRYKNHRRLAGAVNKMLEKFLKYFHPLLHLYAFAFLLDPHSRYKSLKSFLKVLTKQLGLDQASLLDDTL